MLKSTTSCVVLVSFFAVQCVAFGEDRQEQPSVEKNEKAEAAKEKTHPFTILVIDPDGKPVADAQVGRGATRINREDWQFWGIATQWTSKGLARTAKAAVTDAEGKTQMFEGDIPKPVASMAIIARQSSRKLVGIATVSRESLLAASKDKSPITVSTSAGMPGSWSISWQGSSILVGHS